MFSSIDRAEKTRNMSFFFSVAIFTVSVKDDLVGLHWPPYEEQCINLRQDTACLEEC